MERELQKKEPLIKMNRPRDPLWENVVRVDGGILQCKYCPHKFGKGTSITRIRHHWSGVTGQGVKPCVGNVPKETKAVLGRNDSSRIPPSGDLATGLANQSDIREDPLPPSSTGEMTHQREHFSLEDPLPASIIVEDGEPRGDPSQPTNVSYRIPTGEDLVDQRLDTILEDTAYLFDESRGDPLPTSSTVLEEAFEANARQIRSWIMDDEFSTIGIYGMAGVGKTELLKHIHNELLQSQDSTHRLYWVTVSQNFSIERLQNLIAKCIGLDLSSEDDDLHRSIKLSKELVRNHRWILFLDDLWDDFELDAVGIPETIKGCKLIVSTRSKEVCLTVASRSIEMEGVPPSFMDDDVNQLDLQAQEDNFNMSELPSSPAEEVQRSMFCNDQAGQKTLVGNDVINDSIQQTTQFPPSFPQTMVKRAGPRDPFWNYVEEKDDDSVICMFCQRRWSSKTPISRIKWHLSGEEGRGVAICRGVTKEVQEEALKAMRGGNKRHKSTASSINVNDHGISTCPQEQNIENENMGGDIGRVLREAQVVEAGVGDERISSHAVARNDVVSVTGMREQEHRVSEGALESRLLDRALEQSNAVFGNLVGSAERTQEGVQGTKQGAGEERIQSHSQAENAMENSGERSCGHDASISPQRPSTNQADKPQGVSSPPKNQLCLGLGSYYDQLSVKHDVIMDDVQSVVKEKTEPIASMLEQSNAILDKLSGDDGRIQVEVQGLEQGAEEELICLPPEAESGMENTCAEYIQHVDINDSLEQTRLMESTSGRLVQPGTSASSTKIVGRAFEKNVIWSWLMDDKVSIIGIYGMGGNGKTTMLENICNELLEKHDISHSIYWVNVPQDFRIDRSQDLIAKRLDLNLSSKDDDQCRVVELAKELMMKQKWILILNDLWNSFDPQELGIPIPLNGSKFIMTTRSKMVCQQMNCQNSIRVDRLSDEEALTLFMEKLGHERQLSEEEKRIAVDAARECDGMPLGIVTLAESLKGVHELHKWKITLKRLKESIFWEMEDQIFQILRLSYDCLDYSTKQCFVYCALFDESQKIERRELIESFIKEGIIKESDKGQSILDSLENVCLLERIDDGKAVKMHDLLRDMAIQILDDEYSLDMAKEERG